MIVFENFIDANAVLDGASDQVREMDYSQTLEEFQHEIAAGEAEMFTNEHDSNDIPWAPLKLSTIRRKGHDIILFETGALENSLVTVGADGNVSAVAPRGSIFGTDIEYAGFHQESPDETRMPSRPPVGISEKRVDLLAERIADVTVRQMTANGS